MLGDLKDPSSPARQHEFSDKRKQVGAKEEAAGRLHVPEHGHGEPLGEHVHDECPQSLQAGQLVGQVHSAGLLPELEEEDPCICGEGGWDGELNQ